MKKSVEDETSFFNKFLFTDKHAFFVVSYVPAQMCEFVASSASAVKEWMRIIGNTVKTEVVYPVQ